MDREEQDNLRAGGLRRVITGNIVLNALLAAGKVIVGFLASSGALISDGVDSAADVLSALVVAMGIRLSAKASDEEHPFGHERFECAASLVLAFMLAISGAGIGVSAIRKLMAGAESLEAPGTLALIAAGVSFLVKQTMSLVTRKKAREYNSGALNADAWNYQGDAIASLGVFGGILGARLGVKPLEPIAGLLICALIFKVAFEIARDALNRMMDTSCEAATENRMRVLVASQPDVLGIDRLSTRLFGNRIYVEVEISVNGEMSLYDAHAVAQRVHDAIERMFPEVKHCMVHVNPKEE